MYEYAFQNNASIRLNLRIEFLYIELGAKTRHFNQLNFSLYLCVNSSSK